MVTNYCFSLVDHFKYKEICPQSTPNFAIANFLISNLFILQVGLSTWSKNTLNHAKEHVAPNELHSLIVPNPRLDNLIT